MTKNTEQNPQKITVVKDIDLVMDSMFSAGQVRGALTGLAEHDAWRVERVQAMPESELRRQFTNGLGMVLAEKEPGTYTVDELTNSSTATYWDVYDEVLALILDFKTAG